VTWEILRRLYGPDGPVARAYRGVGVSYRDTGCLVSVGGELYIDRDREWDGFFPALAPRSGSAIRWRSWRGAGRTLWNALRLAFFAPGDGRAAIAALRASLAAPSPGNAAAALARLLTDYELVFDVNLRSARALAAAEKKLGRSLSAGEWRAGPPVEFPVPTGVEGNSLEITDTAPFRAAPSRPTGGDGRVPAVARTAAMWARLREASRWLTVKRGDFMNYFLTEEQQAIVETAREIAEKKIKPVREKHDAEESFPWEIVEELRKADLFGVYFTPITGGWAAHGFELVLVVEELSKACGGIASVWRPRRGHVPDHPVRNAGTKKNGSRTWPAANAWARSPSRNPKPVPTPRPPVVRPKKTGISTF
jgi:hypothetical protein